ncbi:MULTISPECIES: helix-turn-helix transcriptional regulator [Pandoraea]|uniref:AraC family transcriptional regulator n=1 Tax=Pandoraea nosoerga TaxID=2508296 RepID=A0A5E4Y2A4_9BURK|nr:MULTISPECIES: helix-turn-helix transcriptional regulator [Pandoraea]VVE42435.1 AraC family transcriptional regulator [Pandoraea nosoerga]
MPITRAVPLDFQGHDRPIGALAKDYPDGYVIRPHSHRRAQLMYACTGILEVRTDASYWVIPPQRALWIPGEITHEVRMRGKVEMRTVYVDVARCGMPAPDTPVVIRVSALLRELILRAMTLPVNWSADGKDGLIMALLLEEMEWKSESPFHLQVPRDARLRKIFDAYLSTPADGRSLQDWAEQVGASSRTLERRFMTEFGLPFREWRQQMRLLGALPLLGAGRPITQVALEVGYDTPSAFSTMFRRFMGVTPSEYLLRGRGPD